MGKKGDLGLLLEMEAQEQWMGWARLSKSLSRFCHNGNIVKDLYPPSPVSHSLLHHYEGNYIPLLLRFLSAQRER